MEVCSANWANMVIKYWHPMDRANPFCYFRWWCIAIKVPTWTWTYAIKESLLWLPGVFTLHVFWWKQHIILEWIVLKVDKQNNKKRASSVRNFQNPTTSRIIGWMTIYYQFIKCEVLNTCAWKEENRINTYRNRNKH